MNVAVRLAVLAAFLIVAPALSLAASDANDSPDLVVADVAKMTAKVVAIDKTSRVVTLEGPQGGLVGFKVNERVKNLENVNEGDIVSVEYVSSVAYQLLEKGEEPMRPQAKTIEVMPKGDKPSKVVANVVQAVATVKAVDYDKRLVTLQGPRGNTVVVDLSDQTKELRRVKVGDEVLVRSTEAVAINVTKPEQGETATGTTPPKQ